MRNYFNYIYYLFLSINELFSFFICIPKSYILANIIGVVSHNFEMDGEDLIQTTVLPKCQLGLL